MPRRIKNTETGKHLLLGSHIRKQHKCHLSCRICGHPDRKKIDSDYLHGISALEIERRYGQNGRGKFTHQSVHAHARRTGMAQQFADNVNFLVRTAWERIDPEKALNWCDLMEALKHRSKVLGQYKPDAGAGGGTNVNIYNVSNELTIQLNGMSDAELERLRDAQKLLNSAQTGAKQDPNNVTAEVGSDG